MEPLIYTAWINVTRCRQMFQLSPIDEIIKIYNILNIAHQLKAFEHYIYHKVLQLNGMKFVLNRLQQQFQIFVSFDLNDGKGIVFALLLLSFIFRCAFMPSNLLFHIIHKQIYEGTDINKIKILAMMFVQIEICDVSTFKWEVNNR